MSVLENRLLLDALSGHNQTGRPPVWLMRQAGRYMPSYQLLRARHSLWDLFHSPELAAKITFLPIEELGVDAAILFSDILVIVEALGLTLRFPEGKGPQVEPEVRSRRDVEALITLPVQEVLAYVFHTIRLVKRELRVPLIGFCGGPFTVASYCSPHLQVWMHEDPASVHALLQKITDVSLDYLREQIRAGVDVVQIFDSWLDRLSFEERRVFAYPYLSQLIEGLKGTSTPLILFSRGSSLFPDELAGLGASCISVDWHHSLHEIRSLLPSIALQGNFSPELLRSQSLSAVAEATREFCESMQGDPHWIANLGHGVLPDTPFENVRCFVDTVRCWTYPKN